MIISFAKTKYNHKFLHNANEPEAPATGLLMGGAFLGKAERGADSQSTAALGCVSRRGDPAWSPFKMQQR